MLSTFGDHNPSSSELYNNGPLNVEKLWSTFSLKRHKANMWMKDDSRFLRQLSFHVFMHFMLLNLNQSNFVRFLLLIP